MPNEGGGSYAEYFNDGEATGSRLLLLGVLTVHIGSSGVWTQHTLQLLLRVCRENAERMMVVVRFR